MRKFMMMALVCLAACLNPAMAQTSRTGGAPLSHEPVPGPAQEERNASGRKALLACIMEKHGPDHGLINGIQFSNRYYRIKEHPYYRGESFSSGSVTISGREYENVLLNYDIYAQQVILEYRGRNGGVGKIILVPEHIDAFRLGGDRFEKRSLTEAGPLFYQVISTDGAAFCIHWERQMIPNSNDLEYTYYFSELRGDFLLDYAGELHRFSNRSSFKSVFPGNSGKQIRKYLRQHRFHFRKASTGELTELLEFIVRLPQSAREQ